MRSTVRVFAVELAFTLVLVLIAEVLFRLFGWDRFWALVAVFLTGHVARAGLARRRRAVLAGEAPSPSR
ncbi:hypothetical protein [Kineococcus rubinsiae]|uniref:hypothetical protein n=1 Tax=Kineococcus rubinsiae TaxID=2609562 RepID=UPI001430CFDE|nr:hypothetical protein [Kineococcus rubinsiae]NIZ90229.1 hypothetical protein [Kineococcus rubinsiae]